MKVQTKNLLLRIVLSPIKLLFHLVWLTLSAFMLTLKWVLYGGDELIYGSEFGRGNIHELVEAIEKLIENKTL